MVNNRFELYATDRTIVTIDDPVRMRILNYLRDSERKFNEIVKYLGKAKSTVSSHLDKLEEEKLISSIKVPEDNRKKIYRINSNLIGRTTDPITTLYRRSLGGIHKIDEPYDFMNSVFRSIRYVFESFGMNTKPLLFLIGQNVGEEIAKEMKSNTRTELLEDISIFWEKNKLGKMQVISENPLTIAITDCYECSEMENVGQTLCSFDEGILKSIFDSKLGTKSIVKEIECNGTGHNNCKFVILFE